MRSLRVLTVDAFADEPLAGHPVGVVSGAGDLTSETRRAVAAELGRPVVFVSEGDGVRVRTVGPGGERPVRPRAVIAALAAGDGGWRVDPGKHVVHAGDDRQETEVEDDLVRVSVDRPEVREVNIDYDRLGEAVGVDPATLRDVGADLPAGVAGETLVVPVNFLSSVGDAAPDGAVLGDLLAEVGATTAALSTFDALGGEGSVHVRTFEERAERPLAGTDAAAVATHCRRFEAFDGEFPAELRVEGGHYLDRPGVVRVTDDRGLRVGGRAAVGLAGDLRVPEPADDDIVEA